MATSPLDLDRPRSLGELLRTAVALYRRHFLLFATIALGVVAPIELAVAGIGLGQLTGPYDPEPPLAGQALLGAVETLLITPLVTAMHIHAVLALSHRERVSIAETARLGLASFAPVLLVVLAYTGVVTLGLLALVVPGIYLAVRCYFVPQAVVADDLRFGDAFRRSWALTGGQWWRVFGITLVVFLILVPISALGLGFEAGAAAAGLSIISLVGNILIASLTVSFAALTGTLLYFDLRARRAEPHSSGPGLQDRPEAPG